MQSHSASVLLLFHNEPSYTSGGSENYSSSDEERIVATAGRFLASAISWAWAGSTTAQVFIRALAGRAAACFEHLHLHFEQFFGHLQPSEQQAEPALHFPLAQQDFPLQAHTTAVVAQQSSGHLQPSTQPVQPAVHFPVVQQFFPLHTA